LKYQPGNLQALLVRGNAYMYQQKFEDARTTFKDLIVAAPGNPVGYFRLGLLERMSQNYEPALDNFEKALKINPKLVDVFTNIILVDVARKDFDRALARCDRQLALVKDAPRSAAVIHSLIGNIYVARKNPEQAEAAFRKAIEENPNFLRPYYSLARIYLAQAQEQKAIAQYNELLKVNPSQAAPHMLLGIIYDTQKQSDLAEKHYRAALDINPEFAPAANNLAFILADQDRDLDEALRLAQLAKRLLPGSPHVMDTLGWVYYKKGLYDSAIGEFSDSLEKIPENAAVNYHLGMAYYKKGENSKARTELEKALRLDENFMGADEARRVLAEL
jgi:tetratricopeptide (TPR) repeat protein